MTLWTRVSPVFEMKRRPDAEPRDPDEDNRSQQNFVALEAELLLHYAGKTLLRLYLAHRGVLVRGWDPHDSGVSPPSRSC